MKIYEALNWGVRKLQNNIENKDILYKEVEEILINVLKIKREKLYVNIYKDLSKIKETKYKEYIEKRKIGYPIQYLLKYEYFYGRKFFVEEGVFIPRVDTETIIDGVKYIQKYINNNTLIADCGSGTGNIGITVLKEIKNIKKIYFFDINKKAIEISQKNAKKYKVLSKIKFINKDFFYYIKNKTQKFDIVVSNPPYIKKSDFKRLQKEVKFEPEEALLDNANGISFYKNFSRFGNRFLKKDGFLIFEIGDNMEKKIDKLFNKEKWKFIKKIKDFKGKIRCLIYQIKK